MNKFTVKACIFISLIISWFLPVSGFAQDQDSTGTVPGQVENYREQIKRLMGFLEFSLNTLGSSETSTKEKEIIINESYRKAFLHEKVQVEDDLDENREILTYKDVQAYLKDVDFFFREATFTIDVQDIQSLTNDQGMTYFKVTANRNLQAVTVDDDTINNNKTRYIEINLDEEEQVLKIASIYTTRLNEAQEMMAWWNGMPDGWKDFLGSGYLVSGEITLNQIDFLDDTTFLLIHEIPEMVEYETYIHIGNDSLMVMEYDTVLREISDTIPAGRNPALGMLKEITNLESLEVPGNLYVYDLYPVDQMVELKTLNISNTLITDLFPARNLTRLITLNISGTGIIDLSPIRYNTQIRELILDSTGIKTLSPIQNFTSLEILHSSNTEVDSLDYIRNLSNIRDLRMDNTPVSDLSVLGDLVNLESLSISGTQIDSLSSLQYLVSLKRINFENTRIDDLAPLSRLENLQIIDADQTLVASLEPLGNIPSLEKVYCNQAQVSRNLANAFMAEHPNVLVIYESQELSSWWAGLSPEWQSVFRGYVKLETTPTTEQLHQLTLLNVIDISGNKDITSLEPLSRLTNLKVIQASGVNISDISPLKELSDLKILSCADTRVSSLVALDALVKIENLDFSNTLVDSLDGLNDLGHLQILKIDKTGVDDLRPVMGCKELDYIYCDQTKLGKMDIDLFLDQHPGCLVIYQTNLLTGWWNGLSPAWKSAFRAHKQIDEPPTREQLHTLAGLTELDLGGNREITTLEPLTTLHRLKDLSIANSTLADINPLKDLVRLEKLNLSGNPVSDLSPISYLPQLVHLDISNTAITKLDALKPLVSLRELNCSGTQIKKLDPVSFLVNLNKLECYNTGINNLKPLSVLTGLKQLVCYNTKLNGKKVEAFKKSMPGIEVVFY